VAETLPEDASLIVQAPRLKARVDELEGRFALADELARVARYLTRDGTDDAPHTESEKAWDAVLSYIEAKRTLFMTSPFMAAWHELEDLQIVFNEAMLAEAKMLGAALDAYDAGAPPGPTSSGARS
jgi:hypothetical protein